MEIIQIKNLTFSYPEALKKAVNNFSVNISDGDFCVLCGLSGCGKSTLLRQLKPSLAPHGKRSGEIFFAGKPLKDLDERSGASDIGFVLQSPENQIVTDKVWHELAFGMESLGYDTPTIRRRVSEMASFFGITSWFHKSVSELSGGQKQLLNLASIMTMQPKLLILDEPTSQLDPIAASDFLAMLKKINDELGITVILTEHRLEEALSMATKVIVMDNGSLVCTGNVKEISAHLKSINHPMFLAMPTEIRVWASVDTNLPCPVTVREGRNFLSDYCRQHKAKPLASVENDFTKNKVMLSADEIWFRYDKALPDTVKGLRLSVHSGEMLCILGGNGTGKSTTLKILSGILSPYRGEVERNGRISLLPQNPQTLFVKKSVEEELFDAVKLTSLPAEEQQKQVETIAEVCKIKALFSQHPFDLSGGEQQRLALAKLLLLSPDILLLDEPTKGMDAEFKIEFHHIIKRLLLGGIAVIMVSHDVEFCAEYGDTCALFFDGSITAIGNAHQFFSGNRFYTTSANRISKDILPDTITSGEIIETIGGVNPIQAETAATEIESAVKLEKSTLTPDKSENLPLWRKIGAVLSSIGAVFIFLYATQVKGLNAVVNKSGITSLGFEQIGIYALLILFLVLLAFFVGKKSKPPIDIQPPKEKRKLSKRTIFSVALIILLIPLTLFIGFFYLGYKQYYLISLVILIECMLPFFMIFEGRKPKARELVIISVLCAIGIAGRAAFFAVPQFKPVLALVIISGVAFGGETGFLVGAVTMLTSNILFSQGPWTPYQMFAMGIIGFIAGILYRKGFLCRSKGSLCVFGAITAIVIYGGIMNPASALVWSNESININMLISYYITGFPMDCIHAFATVIFLWFAAEPMLEKLDRIKVKYGLVQ